MFGKLKRVMLAGAVVAAALAQAVMPASAAGPYPVYVNPAAPAVGVGGTFNVDVVAAVGADRLTSYEFGVNYNPAVLHVTNVALSTALDTNAGGGTPLAFPGSFDNTTGTMVHYGKAILGGTNPGATGNVVLGTVTFQAQPGINAMTPYTIEAILGSLTPVQIQNGNVTVGTPPAPDLIVQGATTAGVAGHLNQFNVNFNVTNQGTANAGASTASVAVTGASPASLTCAVPALAAGVSAPCSVGPFTLGGSLANATITADSTSAVTESNEGNNTGTTAYQYSAYSSNGQTPLDLAANGYLILTAPAPVSGWTLNAGQMNNLPDGYLNVKSNLTSFNVTVSGDNNGHFAEYAGGAYVAGGKQLVNPLNVQVDSGATNVNISGTPQVYVQGTLVGPGTEGISPDPTNGYDFPVMFHQFFGFTDPSVSAPSSYHTVLSFNANGTF